MRTFKYNIAYPYDSREIEILNEANGYRLRYKDTGNELDNMTAKAFYQYMYEEHYHRIVEMIDTNRDSFYENELEYLNYMLVNKKVDLIDDKGNQQTCECIEVLAVNNKYEVIIIVLSDDKRASKLMANGTTLLTSQEILKFRWYQ